MNQHLPPIEAAEIRDLLRVPSAPNLFMRERLKQELVERRGLTLATPLSAETWQSSGRLDFVFDDSNHSVPLDSKATHFDRCKARWWWSVSLSQRGALISCETSSLARRHDPNEPEGDHYFEIDKPPRPIAVQWTLDLAATFSLKYVPALALREWSVSYDDVDPEFNLEHEVLAAPNAFQVLFYE